MESIKWSPIEPESISVDFFEVESLHSQWLEIKSSVEDQIHPFADGNIIHSVPPSREYRA